MLDAAVERSVATGLSWSPYGVELQSLRVVARFVAGDWAGSMTATRHAGRRPPDGMIARLSTVSLHVAVARGDPPALAMVRAMENRWYRDPMIAMISGGCGADLLRWREEPRAALELAERTLEYVEHSWPLFLGAIWLSALGLAAAGDLAEHARLVHDESELTEALDAGERLFAQARNVAREGSPRGGVLGPEGRALVASGRGRVLPCRRCLRRRTMAAHDRGVRLWPPIRAGAVLVATGGHCLPPTSETRRPPRPGQPTTSRSEWARAHSSRPSRRWPGEAV